MPISDLSMVQSVDSVPPVFEELLHTFDTRPPGERGVNVKPSIVNRIKSNWTLKRLGKVAMTMEFNTWFAIFFSHAGNGGFQAAGLVR